MAQQAFSGDYEWYNDSQMLLESTTTQDPALKCHFIRLPDLQTILSLILHIKGEITQPLTKNDYLLKIMVLPFSP